LVHEWFHRSGNARFALENWKLVLPFEASAEYCAEMSTQASERGDEGERKRLAVLEKEFRDASRSGVATAIRRRNLPTGEEERTPDQRAAEAPPTPHQAQPNAKRLPSSVVCLKTANLTREFIKNSNKNADYFASKIGTTGNTIRKFIKTGKVRRKIFEDIENQIKAPMEEYLKQ
jgi:hypothetical protein